MAKHQKLFELDKEQKDLLQRVAADTGLRRSSIQKVWEYTIYALLMTIAENSDATYNVIPVPHIGKILLKESKENEGEYDTFLMVFDSLKEQIKKIKKGDLRDLISYYDENFIDCTINEILK